MAEPQTEQVHPLALGLDALPPEVSLDRLLDGQMAAVAAVRPALSAIAEGAALMAGAVRNGAQLCYVGAGSSALMANADGMELAGTFGLAPSRIRLLMAGGLPVDAAMPGGTEDDDAAGERDAAVIGPGDAVICVAASGRTPYPLAVARAARARGAKVIAIANNPGAPLLALADVAILLATPPELVAGSTRMGAGTAQKVALNLMSTLMAIRLGHVHDGFMVSLIADNAKLRRRACAIVARLSGATEAQAAEALTATDGAVKPAVLIAAGATPARAAALLESTDGHLRTALGRLADERGP